MQRSTFQLSTQVVYTLLAKMERFQYQYPDRLLLSMRSSSTDGSVMTSICKRKFLNMGNIISLVEGQCDRLSSIFTDAYQQRTF